MELPENRGCARLRLGGCAGGRCLTLSFVFLSSSLSLKLFQKTTTKKKVLQNNYKTSYPTPQTKNGNVPGGAVTRTPCRGPGSILGQEARSHMPQLKIWSAHNLRPSAASQINECERRQKCTHYMAAH